MIEFISRRSVLLLFALLLVIIYFPVFLHLDFMPFRMWDESILGVNAIEMMHNHNYIVTYFFGAPDMSNCKPPMMIWCIVLFSKAFGFSELALRLPSALAAAFLCCYLFFTLGRITGNYFFGFFTVLVLITCQGYIRNHVTRTGEYDSLLVLFSTVFSFSLFAAVETGNKSVQSKNLLLFFIFLTLGILTKGVACMMQLPGLFIYTAVRKKIIPFLKNGSFYIGLLILFVFGFGYYFLRESINPGYIKAVWYNELGGRFSGLEGHYGTITYYLNEIVTWQFVNYMFLFPAAVIAGLLFCGSSINRLVSYAILAGFSFLLVISLAGTKLPHYDAPLFPYLAIITAALFYWLFTLIKLRLNTVTTMSASLLVAFICTLSFMGKPYYDIVSKVYFPKGDFWEEGFSVSCRFFQHAAKGEVNASACKLILDANKGYGAGTVLACYSEELKEHGMNARFAKRQELMVNDSAVVFDPYTKQLIEQDYDIQTLQHLDYCDADIIYVKGIKIKS